MSKEPSHPAIKPVIRLVPIGPANAMAFKAVRLSALRDTPTAFDQQ